MQPQVQSNSNPRLNALFNSVDIATVMAKETTFREQKPQEESIDFQVNEDDFGKVPQTQVVETPSPVVERKPDYNAENNARSLVYGLQSLEQLVLNPVAQGKLHYKIGGKKTKKAMREAFQKKNSGEELTDKDNRLLQALEDYDRKMMLLSDEMLPNEKQTELLIRSAIPYCEETQMEVKSGLVFWGAFAGNFVEKITKILMA